MTIRNLNLCFEIVQLAQELIDDDPDRRLETCQRITYMSDSNE